MHSNIAFWGALVCSQVWFASAESNSGFAIAAGWCAYALAVLAMALRREK